MEEIKERFTIRITDEGLSILYQAGTEMRFTALEALMLLDILRNEEDSLRRMADEASPLPVRIGGKGWQGPS